jgi:hypothetical protein
MVLKRQYTHTKQRQESYYNPCTSALWSELSGKHESLDSLTKAIATCDTPVLTVLPNSAGKYPEQKDLYTIPGLEVTKFLSKTGAATALYQGKTVNLYPLSIWFDIEPGANLGQALKAKKEIQRLLEEAFQPVGTHNNMRERVTVPLVANPTQEGLILLQHSLPYGQEYDCSSEFAEALIDFNLQGRIETFYHGQDALDNLYYYDGRWMYANCIRHVPVGRMIHDDVEEIMPYVPGFYRVLVEVPSDWQHIGLFPSKQRDGSYQYPRKPGESFLTWATYPEVALAVKNNWYVKVVERFLWPDTDKQPEPLKQWGEKLISLRQEKAKAYPEPYRTMFRDVFRKLMLQALGSFNRTGKEVDHYTQNIEDLPEDTTSELLLPGDIWKYTTYQDLTPFQSVFYMPHWIKHVWGKSRADLNRAALQVPFKKLVALRVDGIWTDCPVEYPDTGKVGQFTRKPLKQSTGLIWPKDTKAMVKLVQEVKG